MSNARAAAVAGQFYAAEAAQLEKDVDTLLAQVQTRAPCPKVIVAPHAGYAYSGAIAAQAYGRLKPGRQAISRVVLLGPSHRVGFQGIATSSAASYRTPLGDIPLDRSSISYLESMGKAVVLDQAHAQEHSLEVHLPFLQRSLDQFSLVPLVVGEAAPAAVADIIEALWGGPETLVVISTDLSHYLPYAQAQVKDAATTRLIEQRSSTLTGEMACGCRPLNGLLQVLRQRDLPIETITVKNSGDSAGDRNRVVGYGAWVVNHSSATESKDPEPLPLALRQQLLFLARQAILHGFSGSGNFDIALQQYHPQLQQQRGCFVTLHLQNRLRGCIGSLTASRALLVDVVHNAKAAAFRDQRFKPLTLAEHPLIDIHLSILSPAQQLAVSSREELIEHLRPGIDGVILQDGQHRSTYLPSVWRNIPGPQQFVSELRLKAGLPAAGWSNTMQVWTYTTEEFS
jgi:AmmeMemoRadiSam system protein B/AmmeMemoRadiSam system protein A